MSSGNSLSLSLSLSLSFPRCLGLFWLRLKLVLTTAKGGCFEEEIESFSAACHRKIRHHALYFAPWSFHGARVPSPRSGNRRTRPPARNSFGDASSTGNRKVAVAALLGTLSRETRVHSPTSGSFCVRQAADFPRLARLFRNFSQKSRTLQSENFLRLQLVKEELKLLLLSKKKKKW